MSEDRAGKPPIPIGVSNFKRMCDGGYCYVDKTLFIKEVLDAGTEATLFTRPRRFGKTLNMNMLRTFFEKTNEDASRYFRDKKIWEQGPKYTERQGKYPVISVSFASAKASTWDESCAMIVEVLQNEYRRHLATLDMDKLDGLARSRVEEFMRSSPDAVRVKRSLVDLSEILDAAYGVPPIILIDEYDTPIESAWESRSVDHYNRMVEFMRSLLSPALKDNDHLSFACLTGVLRVAREGLFSGLNNLKVDGVLDKRYDECFGFTTEEAEALAHACGAGDKCEEIARWYEGYRFGDQEVFNPWSVLMYLDEGCEARAYWANTSGRGALGEVLLRGDEEFLEGLASLLGGETAWSTVSDSLVYPDLVRGNVAEAAYTLLLMSGYLTSTGKTRMENGHKEWELAIPNRELKDVYPREILDTMPDRFDANLCWAVQKALLGGRWVELAGDLTTLLRQSVSFFDLESEKEYQTWMLGILASMPGYRLVSNREAGEGRFDICLKPRISRRPGVLIEVKLDKDKEAPKKRLEKLAAKAVRQIRKWKYADELRAEGIHTILEFGVAFCGKTAYVVRGDQVPKMDK